MSEGSVHFLLTDIDESIENILNFTRNLSFEMYLADLKTVHAVQHNFMIIGEAVVRISDDYKHQYEHINWRLIKDFRNIIVHDYFGVDSNIMWDIIRDSLPELKSNITELLKKEEE